MAARLQGLASVIWVSLMLFAAPAHSAVSLRVEARPLDAPIHAFVTVTDSAGNPVSGLTATDMSVFVDGVQVASPGFSLPPSQNVASKVSIVFAMDYSPSVQDAALASMQAAVVQFIRSMKTGDYAAIVKFNVDSGVTVVRAFTQIDGAAGAQALIDAVNAPYSGTGTNIYDAVLVSVQQFTAPPVPLPAGPKAVVLVSDGEENSSVADINAAIKACNDAKVPVFTVGVGDFTSALSQTILNGLADQTSGEFYPAATDALIGDAYARISELLNNEYLLSFPSSINDCSSHTLEVRVSGQAAVTETFTRCTSLFAPDVRGQTLAAATAALTNVGLVVGTVSEQANSEVPVGRVVSQSPIVGTVMTPNSAVNLVVSSGAPPAPSGGGGGGGGATGPFEALAGLLLLALAGRRRAT